MFVLKPEARRASCVRSMLSVLLAVKTMGTAPCSWLSHRGAETIMATDRLNTFHFIAVGSKQDGKKKKKKKKKENSKIFNLVSSLKSTPIKRAWGENEGGTIKFRGRTKRTWKLSINIEREKGGAGRVRMRRHLGEDSPPTPPPLLIHHQDVAHILTPLTPVRKAIQPSDKQVWWSTPAP